MVERSPEKAGVGGSSPSLATILTYSISVLYRLVFGRVPILYRKNRLHHLCDPGLPALRPLRVMLAHDGRAVAQNLGDVLKRPSLFEQFRGEGVSESMRVGAGNFRFLEYRRRRLDCAIRAKQPRQRKSGGPACISSALRAHDFHLKPETLRWLEEWVSAALLPVLRVSPCGAPRAPSRECRENGDNACRSVCHRTRSGRNTSRTRCPCPDADTSGDAFDTGLNCYSSGSPLHSAFWLGPVRSSSSVPVRFT